jgi:dephospho-CoA kinase
VAHRADLAEQRCAAAATGGARGPDWHAGAVIKVGLTGGIGAGKSTVARLLAAHGAVVVDADQISRELVAPGEPALAAIVARFGTGMLHPDGRLDRAALAATVFRDPAALAALEAIMHPRINARSAEQIRRASETGAGVAVYDMPLLVETGIADDFDVVVVVEAPMDVRLARLADRGIGQADARDRMARQATDEQRAAVADIVIDNSGDEESLAGQVRDAWQVILGTASS